jgi:membrane-bound inhibitor of C-type lysozyme
MKNWIIGIVIIVLIALGAWWIWGRDAAQPSTQTTGTADQTIAQPRTAIASATYACDKGKTITATFFSGPEAPEVQPGQPPQPTGSADVSLDGGASMTLAQTISADGVRYANSDESFVFWNKGNEALVMRNNSMDLDYTNCTQAE